MGVPHLRREAAPTGVRRSRLLIRRPFERRRIVLGAAAVMFVAIFALLRNVQSPVYGTGLLQVVPIVLVALEMGLFAGIAASALGVVLLAVGSAGGHPADLGLIGLSTRALAFVAVGAVAGRFSDRMRENSRRESELLHSGLQLSTLADPATLAQIIATSARRAIGAEGASVALHSGPSASSGSRGHHVTALAIESHDLPLGRLEITGSRPFGAEDLATLRLLAVQAGLALHNRWLLERERELATVGAELRLARRRLSDQDSELAQLVNSQEAERSSLARTLHEDLAQILAAVLMGLKVLRASGTQKPANPSIEALSEQVMTVLADLRVIADTLRPATLDQLGLGPALIHLAREAQARRGLDVAVDVAGIPERLPADISTGVYRIVEDAIAGGASQIAVLVHDDDQLAVTLTLPTDEQSLNAVRRRTELLRGEVQKHPASDGLAHINLRIPITA